MFPKPMVRVPLVTEVVVDFSSTALAPARAKTSRLVKGVAPCTLPRSTAATSGVGCRVFNVLVLLMQVNAARVMGVVLNAFNLRSADGYYYYGSKYASRYYQQGEEEQKLGASAS